MEITSVSQAIATPATGNVSKAKAAQSNGNAAAADVNSSKIAEIAAKYDPKHISLEKTPEFGKELHDKGLISGAALGVMMGLPGVVKILAKDGQALGGLDVGTDGAVNLVDYWKSLDSKQKTPNATPSADVQGAITAYAAGGGDSNLDIPKVIDVLEAIAKNKKN